MYSTLGETEKAVADLTAYKDLDGGDPVILSSLGQLYETTGDYESAIECYTAGITDERAYPAGRAQGRGAGPALAPGHRYS